MIYPAGNVASVSDPLCATPAYHGSPSPPFATLPLFPPFLAASSFATTLATFLPPSSCISRGEFSGESRFLIYDRPPRRAFRRNARIRAEARRRKWKGEGRVEAGFLLSFISSHFRRSPRYPAEFTMYRIYRTDDIHSRARAVIGTSRRKAFAGRNGRKKRGEGKLTFNARYLDSFGVAKFRVWT